MGGRGRSPRCFDPPLRLFHVGRPLPGNSRVLLWAVVSDRSKTTSGYWKEQRKQIGVKKTPQSNRLLTSRSILYVLDMN